MSMRAPIQYRVEGVACGSRVADLPNALMASRFQSCPLALRYLDSRPSGEPNPSTALDSPEPVSEVLMSHPLVRVTPRLRLRAVRGIQPLKLSGLPVHASPRCPRVVEHSDRQAIRLGCDTL